MHSHDGLNAMVLAAGVGSRLDPLTRLVPKPLVPFANRPVMEHIVRLLKRHGVTRTVSNVHYLPEKVPAYFGDGSHLGVEMRFVSEPALTGDAGGVRACRAHLEGSTFLVVMGDLITDLDIGYVISQHRDKGALATVALKQVPDVERFGIAVLNKDGLITGFQEKPSPQEAKSNLASTGIYVFEPEIFDYIGTADEVGFGKHVFPKLIEQGLPILGVEVWGYWSDVGTIAQYKRSTFDLLEGLIDMELPGELFDYGWIEEGSTVGRGTSVEGVTLIGRDSHIASGVRLEGRTVIGDNCLIESGARIQNSIIWPGTIIGANSTISNSVIGSSCWMAKGSIIQNEAIVEPVHTGAAERCRQTTSFGLDDVPLPQVDWVPQDELELDADMH